MIEGYKGRLARNDALETKLERVSRPVLRRLLVGALRRCSSSVLGCSRTRSDGNLLGHLCSCGWLELLLKAQSRARHRRESWGRRGKSIRARAIRGKAWSLIEYEFHSADHQGHWGTVRGGLMLPRKGQTAVVVHNLEDPSLNLPLSSFWLYQFPFEFPSTQNPSPKAGKCARSLHGQKGPFSGENVLC